MDLERAVELASRSMKEMPPDASLLKDLGRVYWKLKRYRNATDALLLAAVNEPWDPEPHRLLGDMSSELPDRRELARSYYEESLKRLPTQPELIEKVYGQEERQRYEERAVQALESLVDPHLPEAVRKVRAQTTESLSDRGTR